MLGNRIVLLKLEKVIISNAFSYSKPRRVNESSFLIVAGRDGRTANAEHQWQQRQHIYVVYGPPHGWYARFVIPAMFWASAAEVR